MTVLHSNDLQGLDGWGKTLKRYTSKAIAVPKALLIPTKKNIAAATGSLKTAAPIAASVAAITFGVPMLANAASGITNMVVNGGGSGGQQPAQAPQYYDAQGNQISKDQYDALMAQITGAVSPSQAATAPSPDSTAAGTDAAAPVKKTNWLKVAAFTAVGLKLASVVL